MKSLFIIDPMSALNPKKDSSLILMRQAIEAGIDLYICDKNDLAFIQNEPICQCTPCDLQPDYSYQLGTKQIQTTKLTDFNIIVMRSDPPINQAYTFAVHLLLLASAKGALVINHPQSLLNFNEKLLVCQFPELAPAHLVSASKNDIKDFIAEHDTAVAKPLDGAAGRDIFKISLQDNNLGVILEYLTQNQTLPIMVQRYLPQVTQGGDARLIISNGEIAEAVVRRIPAKGELRANLARGGSAVVDSLTQREREIAQTIAPWLKEQGIVFAGLDIIDGYLTEINITSPTGLQELAAAGIYPSKNLFNL